MAMQAIFANNGEYATAQTKRTLCKAAIDVLERELDEQGYRDPASGEDRAALLYALYEMSGHWNKAVVLLERVIEERDETSVMYKAAQNLLPYAQEQAAKPVYIRAYTQALDFASPYVFIVQACGGLLLAVGCLRRESALNCWLDSVFSRRATQDEYRLGRRRILSVVTFGIGVAFAVTGIIAHFMMLP